MTTHVKHTFYKYVFSFVESGGDFVIVVVVVVAVVVKQAHYNDY